MSNDKKDNLIVFPTQKNVKSQGEQNESDKKNADDKVVSLPSVNPGKTGKDSDNENKKSKKNIYTTASITTTLCLMLVGFPFVSDYSGKKERGLDCTADDLACMKRERRAKERLERESERIRRNEKRALNLLYTGQRKLASIGQKPNIQDVFSIEKLKSAYQVRWSNSRLVYAILLQDKTPVFLPAMEKLLEEYKDIFPEHTSVNKLDSVSEGMEVFELRDSEGLNVAQVETLRDRAGRVISIHVQ